MLFDLRGRGRRRTVQVIYLSLALLLGGGLVLFGIGGDVQGGLFDAFSSDSGRTTTALEDQRQGGRGEGPGQPRRTRNAWAALALAKYNLAGQTDGFDAEHGHVRTDEGESRGVAEADARVGAPPGARGREARRRGRRRSSRAPTCRSNKPEKAVAGAGDRPRLARQPRLRRLRRSSPSRLPRGPDPQGRPRRRPRGRGRQGGGALEGRARADQGVARAGQAGSRPGGRAGGDGRSRGTARSDAVAPKTRRYPSPPRPCSSTGRAADS